jgi:hypothetical protein
MAIVTKPAPINANMMPSSRPSEDIGVEGGYSIAMAGNKVELELVSLNLDFLVHPTLISLAAGYVRSVRFAIHSRKAKTSQSDSV